MGATLTPERLGRLQSLFERALLEAPDSRTAFLERETPDDPSLRIEVLALLAAHASTGTALSRPVTIPGPELLLESSGRWVGQRFGPWQVTRRIGQGGMGTVCEAQRADEQFEKRVAIKLLRWQATEPAVVQRFCAERQFLANLEHPNIAMLLDGGVSEDGQPYLVMEYVDGQEINAWADGRQLDRRARVALMLQVCAAVEAAHRQLIVHRDLKPGNILVTEEGRVKLLDFGIARLLDERGTEPAETQAGESNSYTPDYAAPEQMRAQALSAATDVYALGVILYQLLTGRLPYTRRTGPDTVAEPARLDPELDAVLARALEIDVGQRYATVQTLRADLEHWLKGEPVSAYPDSRAYRWRKFLGRHRLGAALAAMASLAILTSGGVALWQAHEARQAAADMRQWNEFLMDVLRMSSPFEAGDELTLSEALDRAAEQIDARFVGRPDLSAEIRFGIGYSMIDRHRLAQADVQLERALKESIAVFGHDDLRTLRVREAIAGLWLEQSRYAEAERGLLEVMAALRQHRQEAVPLYARAANNLGNLYLVTERFAEAERLLEEAQRADLAHGSLTPADRAGVLSNLAHAAHGLEELERADRYYSEAASAYREIFPDGSPDLAIILNNHALLHEERNDPGKALALHRQSLAMRRQVLGAEHPMVVTALTHVARLLIGMGEVREGLALAQEAARMADRVYTDPDRFHPLVYVTLARAQAASGDADAALDAWRRARELLERLPDPPPSTVSKVEEARALVCRDEYATSASCSL